MSGKVGGGVKISCIIASETVGFTAHSAHADLIRGLSTPRVSWNPRHFVAIRNTIYGPRSIMYGPLGAP